MIERIGGFAQEPVAHVQQAVEIARHSRRMGRVGQGHDAGAQVAFCRAAQHVDGGITVLPDFFNSAISVYSLLQEEKVKK